MTVRADDILLQQTNVAAAQRADNLAVFALRLGLSSSVGFKIKFGTHIKVGTLHGHDSLVLCLVFASLTRFFIIMYDLCMTVTFASWSEAAGTWAIWP